MNSAEFGVLTVKNWVSTYTTQIGKTGQSVNLPAVAVVCAGKYSPGVFPAVVSKARISLSDAPLHTPDAAAMYPLHRKVKQPKSASAKSTLAARNKKLKELMHVADRLAPRQFFTATDSQFKSGQNVVAGGTSMARNMLVAYTFVRRLNHDLHLDLRIYNMQTQNIVCSADLGFEVNTEWLVQEANAKGWEVSYHPEEFIGLSWVTYDDDIKIVYGVFSSGRIIATGIREMQHIAVAQERMHRLISPFRRGNEPANFCADHPHMRDAETLGSIKKEVLSNSNRHLTSHSKVNAAKKHSKKLTREVKVLMKQIACVIGDEDGDQEHVELPNFEDIMDATEAPLPARIKEEAHDSDAVVWMDQ